MLSKYIGSRHYYSRVLSLAVPIMLQNAITNFVNMLDNIMVGRVGTVEMSGVAISNQLLFVFNLCIFGAVSGAGIFGAQFFGKGDNDGLRNTFRFKMVFCVSAAILGIALFSSFDEKLILLYLNGEGSPADAAASLMYARDYLRIMLIGVVPFAAVQCYSSTLREIGRSVTPMLASFAAVLVNLTLNYALIFGRLGAPCLGVSGAAIATVVSRFVELAVVAAWTHIKQTEFAFIRGVYRTLLIPKALAKDILVKSLPLTVNETMWAVGIAALSQCYSVRSLDVVAADNIYHTFFNLFSVVSMSLGAAIGIILGQKLGAGKNAEAMDDAVKLPLFSVFISLIVTAVYYISAGFIPYYYNTTPAVRALAASFLRISALTTPIDSYTNACYFTLRSGGRVFITMLFDSCFTCLFLVPLAFVLTRFTSLPIIPVFAICQFSIILKCLGGHILVRRGVWIKNMVS